MKEKYLIEGMTCAACQSHVQNAVSKVNGIKSVNVNLLSNSMEVEYDENVCSSTLICESVRKAGYKYIKTSSNPKLIINLINL